MDNVTHSLAGLLLAEGATQLRAHSSGTEPGARFRATAAIASVVAANLPDFDLLYTGAGGDHLAYMLYHRGYTHTVLLAIVGALLVWGSAWTILRWRAGATPSRDDARWLLALLLVGTLSHLVLDWTNSYGVHPFWPVDDRWYYGDSVFILEPWFWVVSIPALVVATRSPIVRVVLVLPLALVGFVGWRSHILSPALLLGLAVAIVVSITLARALSPGRRVAAAIGGWLLVTLVMATGAAIARHEVERVLRDEDPGFAPLDVVITPLPASAACFQVITVERLDTLYRIRIGRAVSVPSLLGAASCDRRASFLAPDVGPENIPSTRAVQWDQLWTAPISELTTVARTSCTARAALRFIRVPGLGPHLHEGVPELWLDDVRFGGGGFSSVRVDTPSADCPAHVPPWIPPRADLLGAATGR